MINPNKSYKGLTEATVTKVDDLNAYIPYVTVLTDEGRTLEGCLTRCYSRPHLIEVGMRVRYRVHWSIVSDKPVLDKLIRIRSI